MIAFQVCITMVAIGLLVAASFRLMSGVGVELGTAICALSFALVYGVIQMWKS